MVNAESRRVATPAIAVAATFGLAAACWVLAARLMDGMNTGVASRPGSFGFFAATWTAMMAALVALDVMSLLWMAVVAVLACTQKLLPARAAIDVPVALAIVGLGFMLVFAPSLVPGLTAPAPPAMPM